MYTIYEKSVIFTQKIDKKSDKLDADKSWFWIKVSWLYVYLK